jgi:hypothetical protein
VRDESGGLWQFIALPLLVHYPGHSSHCVAADPDIAINLADVDPATPTDGGALSGDVGTRRPLGSDQPLAESCVQAAGDGIFALTGQRCEASDFEVHFRPRWIPADHPDGAEPIRAHSLRAQRQDPSRWWGGRQTAARCVW